MKKLKENKLNKLGLLEKIIKETEGIKKGNCIREGCIKKLEKRGDEESYLIHTGYFDILLTCKEHSGGKEYFLTVIKDKKSLQFNSNYLDTKDTEPYETNIEEEIFGAALKIFYKKLKEGLK